ncbi:MAG: hypothetical protein HY675_19505 [Chloroflexi bacterium]|nr:hypothetical protein [Chloroflexota bacterium]
MPNRLRWGTFRNLVAILALALAMGYLGGPKPSWAVGPPYRAYLPAVFVGYNGAGQEGAYYNGAFGYGMFTVYPNSEAKVAELGFGYVKYYAKWADYESTKGQYAWLASPATDRVKTMAERAAALGVRVVVRLDYPPAWAAPGSGNRPPANPADFGNFVGAYAQFMKGRVAAYEIWNEPNLSWEWGNMSPDPERYTQLLMAAYPRIKAADPQAIVISAGLASTGGDGGVTAMNDVEFIDRMYRAGARNYFDALGSHPYGFANSPETRNGNNVTDFQRAADQHAVMERYGDGAKRVWATEFGWLLDPAYYGHPEYVNSPLWAGRQWQRVAPQTQADYVVRAYQYAYANWPWMAVMMLFNLDFSMVDYYPPEEPMRWYSIVNADYSPRPAYTALRTMAKPIWR